MRISYRLPVASYQLARTYLSLLFVLSLSLFCFSQSGSDTDSYGPAAQKRIIDLSLKCETMIQIDERESIRKEVMDWWIKNPDISLNWCGNILAEGKNPAINQFVATQGMFGAGVFILQNPKKAGDDAAVYLAGVERALRLYKTALGKDKKYEDDFLNKLLKMKESGSLKKWVENKVKICKKEEKK
jgi:hypothetical protein